MKKCGSLLLTMLLLGTITYSAIRIGTIEETEGEAMWISTNGQKYLEVSASIPYDLGYLTGQQIASQVLSLKVILMALASQSHTDYKTLKTMADEYLPFIPDPYLEEMR